MKKDTTEPTGLQQAMASVDAGESPFGANASIDFTDTAALATAPDDELIEPSVRPTVFGQRRKSGMTISAAELEAIAAAGPSTEIIPDSTATLVAERGKTHGAFADHARITQSLKRIILLELDAREFRGQPALTDAQHESIDMIVHKIGRIVAGESAFQDHWDDISGYARIANS